MKTAIITGCNRGLGFSLLEHFCIEGYDIIALVRNDSPSFLQVIQDLSKLYGVCITPIKVNLANPSSLSDAAQAISAMEKSIDVLINNAAVNISKPVFYLAYEELLHSFQVNYFAPVMLCKEIGALMMRQGNGSIINISSVAGFSIEPGGAAYDASKAALNTFTQSFAQEIAPFGIRINAIACSVIATDMFNEMKPEVQKKILKRIGMKRPSELDEVAQAVLFLASEKASYITGHILRVDGGYAL